MKKFIIDVISGASRSVDLTPEEDAARFPTPEHIAKVQQRVADKDELSTIKQDNFVQSFVAMTPQQVQNYVEANVSNLAEAKVLLKRMALMLLLLAKRTYR